MIIITATLQGDLSIMSQFVPIEGTITAITPFQTTVDDRSACSLLFTLQNSQRETFRMVVDPNTFILNQTQFRRGDSVTAFYDQMVPVPLIFPPQYRAVAMVRNRPEQSVTLDYFNRNLLNSDNTLRLNRTLTTNVRLQNGQRYMGNLGNQLLLVIYGAATRSIPAQTTPSVIVVFCNPA